LLITFTNIMLARQGVDCKHFVSNPKGAPYKAVLRSCTSAGWVGGVVLDALHLYSAQKADCERIYTFNVRDFRSLATAELADKIAAP
jgi:hypothetical protein